MQNSDVLFNTLIATAVDGIMIIDEMGLIQVYSDACERMFGYARERGRRPQRQDADAVALSRRA